MPNYQGTISQLALIINVKFLILFGLDKLTFLKLFPLYKIKAELPYVASPVNHLDFIILIFRI